MVYVSTKKHRVNTFIGEHNQHCHLGQSEKSAQAKHGEGHKIWFDETQLLSLTQQYFAHLQIEVIEIHSCEDQSMNRKEEGGILNKFWLPALKWGYQR